LFDAETNVARDDAASLEPAMAEIAPKNKGEDGLLAPESASAADPETEVRA
jgi:hypothetical protein